MGDTNDATTINPAEGFLPTPTSSAAIIPAPAPPATTTTTASALPAPTNNVLARHINILDFTAANGPRRQMPPPHLPAWFRARNDSHSREQARNILLHPFRTGVADRLAVRVPPVQGHGRELRGGAGAYALCALYGDGEGEEVVL